MRGGGGEKWAGKREGNGNGKGRMKKRERGRKEGIRVRGERGNIYRIDEENISEKVKTSV